MSEIIVASPADVIALVSPDELARSTYPAVRAALLEPWEYSDYDDDRLARLRVCDTATPIVSDTLRGLGVANVVSECHALEKGDGEGHHFTVLPHPSGDRDRDVVVCGTNRQFHRDGLPPQPNFLILRRAAAAKYIRACAFSGATFYRFYEPDTLYCEY